MSETTITTEPAAAVEAPEAVQAEVKETDWKAEARKHEARAKENAAKAKANESAAQRLAEIEEANKTAEEKANERLAAAEKRAAELEAKANRATVANEHGVPSDLIAGPASDSPDDLNAYAEALIAWKGTQASGPYVPAEGKTSPALALNGDGIEATLRQKLGIA